MTSFKSFLVQSASKLRLSDRLESPQFLMRFEVLILNLQTKSCLKTSVFPVHKMGGVVRETVFHTKLRFRCGDSE